MSLFLRLEPFEILSVHRLKRHSFRFRAVCRPLKLSHIQLHQTILGEVLFEQDIHVIRHFLDLGQSLEHSVVRLVSDLDEFQEGFTNYI